MSISDLQSKMDDAVKTVVVNTLTGMVPRVIATLLPGTGGLTAIYNAAQFLLSNASRFNGLLNAFFDSLKAIEAKDPTKLQAKLGELFDAVIPTVLSYLATQMGLGQLPTTLRSALSYVPNQVDAAIRKAVASLVASGKGAAGGGTAPGPSTGSAAKSVSFTYQNRSFRLSVTPPAGQPKVKLEETTGGTSKLLGVVTSATLKGDPVTIGHLGAIEAAATALFQSTRRAPGTPAAANAPNPLPNQTQLQTNVENAEQNLAKDFSVETVHACTLLTPGCFPAGVDICTRNGWRKVETIRKDDWALSQNENDPNAAPDWKQVEAVFERTGRVFHLHLLSGELIRTTQEHPFWVDGQGWLQAGGLKPGDRLHRLSGEWATVVELFDTGEYEKVYNCRVADWHTYFVGGEGCEVWAHNATCVAVDRTDINYGPVTINGREVYGTAQNIKNTPSHAADINTIVDALSAQAPNGTYFVLNRSWRTALGRPNVPLGTAAASNHPDILIVEPLGQGKWKVHAIEVLSGNQIQIAATTKLKNEYQSLPNPGGDIGAGTFDAVDQSSPGVPVRIPQIAW